MKVEWREEEHYKDGGHYVISHDNGHLVASMCTFGRNETARKHAARMAAAGDLLIALEGLRDIFDPQFVGMIAADMPAKADEIQRKLAVTHEAIRKTF